ncbi:hypothetical protein PVL29_005730 [Vitis rotundifolia]|uniref:Uncharacterized protein n=1 Tax=Vitis rotundifolia TaxID=103349 RepID=A0AA39A313_VITRO|nr:hypothetical protein PVL29_005730 [Vitis rotundifolia]
MNPTPQNSHLCFSHSHPLQSLAALYLRHYIQDYPLYTKYNTHNLHAQTSKIQTLTVEVTVSITSKDVVKEEPVKLVSPKNPIPFETVFLSNIDLAVTFPVETLFFFEVPPSKVQRAVAEVLLVPYYFLAGRLYFNHESKRLELLCNNAGVLFVRATSGLMLKDLGNHSLPNPIFRHFVTRFRCGGFSIGIVTNHGVVCNDTRCMRARNPPQTKYPHQENVKPAETSCIASSFTFLNQSSPSPSVFSNKYIHKLFPFHQEMLATLKEKAMNKCSTFNWKPLLPTFGEQERGQVSKTQMIFRQFSLQWTLGLNYHHLCHMGSQETQ